MNASRYLSYLDLMCCGFGGAVLMFLIVASARPEQHPTDQLLVVRCRALWESAPTAASADSSSSPSTLARAEAGLEYRRAGDVVWRRLSPRQLAPDRWVFMAPSKAGSGTETILVWRHPPQGRWEFRPYLIDFPAARQREVEGQTTTPGSTAVPVRLEVQARRLRSSGETDSVLRLPGETGGTLVVELE
ncbi:MAG: hypothetical protein U0939_25470 [Pirellulales bacterium]